MSDEDKKNLKTAQELETECYPKTICDLSEIALEIQSFSRTLKTIDAKEHCIYGLCRRILTLRGCLSRILLIAPPTRTKVLLLDEKIDLTSHLHCFFINNSGSYDNLAWIWYWEKLGEKDKENFKKYDVDLFKKKFQQCLPQQLKEKCKEFNNWHNYLIEFRDPLAHRIPFYVPLYDVPKKNSARYAELNSQWHSTLNPDEMKNIMDEMDSLGVYAGEMIRSPKNLTRVNIHQVLTDAITLLDMIELYLKIFKNPGPCPGK